LLLFRPPLTQGGRQAMATNGNFYITTAIPYVNAEPHLGHALELVQADALARHRRRRGQPVRFLTGTDDHALKNVTAARAAGVDVREFVDRNAARFRGLREPLALSFDDFIGTSADPRHRAGVERLWRQCAERGDFYLRHYEGRYCPGCEQFYTPAELDRGLCPEHRLAPEPVRERNWFFRLSRYTGELLDALRSGRVRVEPAARRNEVLAFIRAGLADFSVSRPAARASGWGIPVPGHPDQVIYVWWDALANYVTALGYGGGDEAPYRDWWVNSGERVHVIGKGVTRFHAVSWLALLLSARQPLPTAHAGPRAPVPPGPDRRARWRKLVRHRARRRGPRAPAPHRRGPGAVRLPRRDRRHLVGRAGRQPAHRNGAPLGAGAARAGRSRGGRAAG
jgi:methionyl-tRNA synthetase